LIVFLPKRRAKERILFHRRQFAQLPRYEIVVVAPFDRRIARPFGKYFRAKPKIADLLLIHRSSIAKPTTGNEFFLGFQRFVSCLASALVGKLFLFAAELLVEVFERLVKRIVPLSRIGRITFGKDLVEAFAALSIAGITATATAIFGDSPFAAAALAFLVAACAARSFALVTATETAFVFTAGALPAAGRLRAIAVAAIAVAAVAAATLRRARDRRTAGQAYPAA
jgi:hypothetical protein